MKKILAMIVMVLFVASFAAAADMMTIKTKQGNVTFNHKVHGESAKCNACHTKGVPGKLALGRDAAHKLCKGCHETKKAGPVKCFDCHKKK